MQQALTPFHIAVQVRDIAEARRFYGKVLGCSEGRSSAHWVDFNLYGHQFVCHLNPHLGPNGKLASHFNPVDGQGVPVPHCGVVLSRRSGPSWPNVYSITTSNSSSSRTRASKAKAASSQRCSSSTPRATRSSSKRFRTLKRSYSLRTRLRRWGLKTEEIF